ncbi:protealysin inhibitor emfourin [Arthrobacter sp. B10-11]|uniref:protealysin inhibitor emfourin n=1 Tax=Arthrobacter sp. B10-11 TaxID=3081160 RepID=UPI0029544591|nr:protealysin inhibitor emfourin [Arthrobacter sp. B10-11]MDV8146425.1 protealysin inhibitor emfourin [Arthrobacter sp. B10-11]
MKITVQRNGGIAALKRVWSVQATTPTDMSRWEPLVEACPWDAVPRSAAGGQPDRFTYSIKAGQRRATLPEQAVTGPWRVLVDNTRAAAEAARNEAARNSGRRD